MISNIAKNYPASAIRRMFELANQYEDIIKLTVGEPNFETPDHIKIAAKKGIDENLTHYVSNAGTDELRQAVAKKYTVEFGVEYTPEQIMVAFGGMEAIMLALVATINPGDEVIIADPAYPNYIGQVLMLGGKAVPVPVYEENAFKLKAEDVEKAITPKTKAIILNSPSNPLGAVLDEQDIKELAEVVLKHNLIVISDEVYEKIIYDDKVHFSIAQIPEVRDNVLIINSLSKTYAMTGWRVGFVIGNEEIISTMPKIQEGIASCIPPFIQKAAVEAINGPQSIVNEMLEHYKRRREILITGLNEIPGFSCINTEGSFYAFPNIKEFKKSSEDFAIELLTEAGVAVTPGSAFGRMGEGYLRFSFATSDENLVEAVRRIGEHVKKNY
ncbi:pyridoxal phosphate-dependent aminotransferase [Bacillus norwichensis]|uniref:Aminotransferase n=1 Tax=Bacillus norwichensis TaxID=2762217 RepID=A0ABR8VQ78_9BACI|nr:pyridoxal phosphate-dependent aminotransferase [Bacillus norwichensis]MBD8006915.1 pyridoxal phosphate-dependent aminotransferase [Bacillus norwichensis]